ncbi:MAG: GTP 3',8-cyclase MoaA [Candidatus Heimdallarchaeota archaeon]|nr:GTP 3',8-cyclase MoaA [Candidatus Heimdallarchaeota archaeon]
MTLIDMYNRKIGSVRISITDRCNLRCQYCMPEDGIEWQKKDNILSFEEILFLIEIFYNEGIRSYRITGGEPTIREDHVKLIKMIKSKFKDIDLSMTTNGLKLKKYVAELKKAGLDRINVSLDTLDHIKFEVMTRRKNFQDVLDGIDEALKYDFMEIKINAVSLNQFNDDYDSLKDFIDFSEDKGIEIRFIEFMPFTGMNWNNGEFVTSKNLIDTIGQKEKMIPLDTINPSQTSRTWSLRNGKAKIGFISSVSESFCHSCNRVRITADGDFRPCLHNSKEYPLRDLIRSNSDPDTILKVIKMGLQEKWKEHPDFLSLNYIPPFNDREMIRIGG